MSHLVVSYLQKVQFWMDSFYIWHKWSPTGEDVSRAMTFCLLPWPICSRSLRHEFAIKLHKYGTCCRVRSTAITVLDRVFPYLAWMTTSIRGCFSYHDLWPWPLSSRSFKIWYTFSCPPQHVQFWIDYLHSWHKWSLEWEGVSHAMTVDLDL